MLELGLESGLGLDLGIGLGLALELGLELWPFDLLAVILSGAQALG